MEANKSPSCLDIITRKEQQKCYNVKQKGKKHPIEYHFIFFPCHLPLFSFPPPSCSSVIIVKKRKKLDGDVLIEYYFIEQQYRIIIYQLERQSEEGNKNIFIFIITVADFFLRYSMRRKTSKKINARSAKRVQSFSLITRWELLSCSYSHPLHVNHSSNRHE